MKKFSLAALLIASAAFVACSSSDNETIIDEPQPVNPTGQYTMTIKASKSTDEATTRALSLDGTTLKATWAKGETVGVSLGDAELGTLTATPKFGNTSECTLSGTLSGEIATGAILTLKFNTASYGGQDGTLNYIATHCDYAEATTTVTVEGNTITGSDATFENKQAIAKFTLVDKYDSNEETNKLSPTSLTMTVDVPAATMTSLQSNQYTSGLATALKAKLPATYNLTIPAATYTSTTEGDGKGPGVLYLAIPDKLADMPAAKSYLTFTLTATVGDDTYSYTKTGFPFENGKYYDITVKMTHTPKTYNLAEATGDITLKDGDTAEGTLSSGYKVSIAPDATVTLNGVEINQAKSTVFNSDPRRDKEAEYAGLTCLGNATIILADGTKNNVRGHKSTYPGIEAGPAGTTLTIKGTGTLITSSEDGAGIGSRESTPCGNISIEGGTVVASSLNITRLDSSGDNAAGIGGICGDITISGGEVTAIGDNNAAGIGSGDSGTCGNITITGGSITATGDNAAGIGGFCGDITISGGEITATGGTKAAGIGSNATKSKYSCGDISITGGNVTATGGDYAAGIGSGGSDDNKMPGNCGTITINTSGTVTATGGNYAAGIGTGQWGWCGSISVESGTVTADRGTNGKHDIGLGHKGKFTDDEEEYPVTVDSSVKTSDGKSYYLDTESEGEYYKGYNHE